jgi:hypothetical protein
MNRSVIAFIIQFFLFGIAQIVLFKRLVLFDRAFCLLYVAFILLLPIDTNHLILMLLAFLLGFSIDIFYDSLGLHAMSLVAVAYLRNYWLSAITPQGGYDSGTPPTLAANGLQWFLVYTLPLLFVHHVLLFFVEAGGFHNFWFTMMKVIASLFFTLTVLLLLQYMQRSSR